MKNKIVIGIILLVLILVCVGALYLGKLLAKEEKNYSKNKCELEDKKNEKNNSGKDSKVIKEEISEGKIKVVPSLLDEVEGDGCWCGTFQVVWNDVKRELAKKDIVFKPSIKIAENLNKETFKEDMISKAYYYKKYGFKTLKLKKEIEKGIKDKFNQKSDILDKFEWDEDSVDTDKTRYFFYSMLYRKFKYPKQFDKLDNSEFGDIKNVEYFGISNSTNESVDRQMKVLFYNTENEFAIKINTDTNDEIIFYKNPKGDNFQDIYDNMNKEAEKYSGGTWFNVKDTFKAPYLKINEEKDYTELKGKTFKTKDNNTVTIVKALQAVKLSIDDKGGEIKSEAGMDVMLNGIAPVEDGPRRFYLDNTFVMFLKESDKDMPYFAVRVEDIKKYQ